MATSKVRELRGWSRFQADEAIWPAQVATFLPMVSEGIGIVALIFAIGSGGVAVSGQLTSALLSLVILVIHASLYALAAAWLGERRSRGVWLATVLFVWALIADVVSGHLFPLGATYDVLALILVTRAGRAIAAG